MGELFNKTKYFHIFKTPEEEEAFKKNQDERTNALESAIQKNQNSIYPTSNFRDS